MPATNSDNVRYEAAEQIAWVTVNRPQKLNALNRETMGQISAAVERAVEDAAVRVVVVSGAGERAFVAGADIEEMAQLGAAGAQSFSRFLQRCLERIERCPKPVIAAVNGFALGGGCELALACHVRIAADTARFGQPEVNLGLIPGAGGTLRLQRVVGRGRALDLILSGETIDAAEAQRIGLVNRVVAAAELRGSVVAYARTLAAKSPLALSRAIEAVVAGGEIAQPEAARLEAALFGLCFATEDIREGLQAFLEKRKPSFKGR